MAKGNGLYEQVVTVAHDYFGPAAPRYVERLIRNHLKKAPEDLGVHDLPQLTEWAIRTTAMLTDDKMEIRKFETRLQALTNRTSQRAG